MYVTTNLMSLADVKRLQTLLKVRVEKQYYIMKILNVMS